MTKHDDEGAPIPRSRFEGVYRVVRFNWSKYLLGCVSFVGGIVLFMVAPLPDGAKGVLITLLLIVGWWLVAALSVTHWVYDRSELTRWAWLVRLLREEHAEPHRWLNVHSGYDETSETLRHLLPGTHGAVLDLYDATIMKEPSVRRARALFPAPAGTVKGEFDAWPFADAEFDTVLLLMAAHEFREAPEREALFAEARRVLANDGRIVMVEHLRDVWNALAFGPGYLHFWPRGEWQRLAAHAKLIVLRESRLTPFVAYLVLGKQMS